jgi:uncharacterized protein
MEEERASGYSWRRALGAVGRAVLFTTLFFLFVPLAAALLAPLRGLVPLPAGSAPFFWGGLAMLVAAVAAGWLMLRAVDRRGLGDLGFAWRRGSAAELLGGLAIGGGSLAAVVLMLALAGLVRYRPEPGGAGEYLASLAVDLLVLAPPATAEEALFRGYPFQALLGGVGAVGAVAVSSLAFAVAHGANPNVGAFALVNIFLAGVLLAVAYLRTRSLWLPTGVHVGWNWTMASLLDLPVSGLDAFDTPLYTPVIGGPEWVTGGAFGPEGGIAGTIGFGLALAGVLLLPAAGARNERDDGPPPDPGSL